MIPEKQTSSQTPPAEALHQRHFKSFWPIVLIAVFSALVGGLLVWALFNQGLDEELTNLIPGKTLVHKKQANTEETQVKDWQLYQNEDYGFEFTFPSSLYHMEDKNVVFKIQNTPLPLELGGVLSPELRSNAVEGRDYSTQGYSVFVKVVNKKETDEYNKKASLKITKLSLANIKAIRVDKLEEVTRGPVVYIEYPKYPDRYVVLGYGALCEDKNICTSEEVDDLFNQILSTFKFTP